MSQAPQHDLVDNIAEVVNFIGEGGTLAQVHNLDERELEAVYALAYNHYRQARWVDALKGFTFLVIHNQWEKRYLMGRAACLQMLKQFEAAFKAYSLAYVLDATDPMVLLHMAECLIGLGKKEEALDALKGVVSLAEGESRYAELALRAKAMVALLAS